MFCFHCTTWLIHLYSYIDPVMFVVAHHHYIIYSINTYLSSYIDQPFFVVVLKIFCLIHRSTPHHHTYTLHRHTYTTHIHRHTYTTHIHRHTYTTHRKKISYNMIVNDHFDPGPDVYETPDVVRSQDGPHLF